MKAHRSEPHAIFNVSIVFLAALLISCLLKATALAQVGGQNVNMVSGTNWPNGDPFLQRQNEPSIAVSTRNSMHILGGANDYRTVDLEFSLSGGAETGDAWLGLFKSFDGGLSWQSTLLPGCQESVSQCKDNGALGGNFQAASDPVVRAGTNGMFYYAGLAFDRAPSTTTASAVSSVFVARYDDLNNNENSDTITYLDTHIVAAGNSAQFLDKPSLAVDIPRSGASTCSFVANEPGMGSNGGSLSVPQSFPAGNVYLAYTDFLQGTKANSTPTHLMFTRSTDCGVTWSVPVQLNTGTTTSQGSAIAVNALNGNVYVTWRQFASNGLPNAIMAAVSTNAGRSFSAPVQISSFQPFDQGTTGTSFRTNAYPSITTDMFGFVYVAFSARGLSSSGDARIVVAGSIDGKNWTPSIVVDNPSQNARTDPSGRGHQIMPAITFAQGRLTLLYYDLRLDHYAGFYSPNSSSSTGYTETLEPEGELAPPSPMPSEIFTPFIDDYGLTVRRHTLDLRVLELGLFPTVVIGPSVLISQYEYGCCVNPLLPDIEQIKFNVPNLPLFDSGQEPFLGDYVDIVPSPWFVPSGNSWKYNFMPSVNPLFHATWTDNRDVVPPANGNWADYTPAVPPGTLSVENGTPLPMCSNGNEGMRNQNIYTSQVTGGLVVGAPGNAKPLGTTINPTNGSIVPFQRAFAVEAQNITGQTIYVQMTIANQPTGGSASFLQFSKLTTLQVTIPPYSSVSRSVFVTSTNAEASVTVNVTQISGIGGTTVTNGLSGSTVLNPDITNPNITNPNITNPNITNPNITNYEVTNPNITNPNITNPNITNPNITNPNITNPNITNPNITNPNITNTSAVNITAPNPNITNPNITNPNITNPNITNPDITNGAIQDVNYGITNEGNTTSSYTVKLATFSAPPGGIVFQLILNKLYQTPTAQNCQLLQDTHWNTVANIVNPKLYQISDPNLGNPNITNSAPTEGSMTLNPGETGYITARVVTPPGVTPINPLNYITPVTIAQAVNTQTVLANPGNTNLTSPPVYPQLTILNAALPPTDRNDASYSMQLTALGGKPGARIWTIKAGGLPPGINLSSSGLISGTATTPGSYQVTIQVTDANSPADIAVQNYVLNVSQTPLTTQSVMPPPDGVVGQQYVATPLAVTGGTTPYTFTATGLPPGLSINSSTGQITGIPTVGNPAGSPVMVTATDAAIPAEQQTYSPTIRIGAAIQIFPAAPATLAGGTLNVPYSNSQLTATGGIGGLVFGPPTLPNGGLLSSNGQITFASPSVPSVSFTVSVHDQANPNQTVTSGTYTINFGSGNIHFVAQPSNTVVNQTMTPAVAVQVLDSSAAAVPGAAVALTMTGPGTLGGSTIATTDATGIATFANLTVSAVGTADTLQASVLGAMVTSNAFNITAATAQACAPTPGPLLSWWPFNGNALDTRGGRPGTILGDTGGQSQFVSAQVGQGFKSGGEGILITTPTTPYLTPVNLTVGAWVRVDSLSNDATEQIVWQGDTGNTDFTTTPYSLGVLGNGSTAWVTYGGHSTFVGSAGPGKIVATFSDGVNELDMFSNTALTPGVFYHVAITWDGPSGGASIWINGALDQTSGPTPLAGLLTPTNPFQIGGIQGTGIGTESFNGVIDELQVWGNVLSQYQMQAIYGAGSAGQCQNIWFTETNGSTNRIGSIAPDGSNATEYTPPTANGFPYNITAGPDGNVWFTENNPNNIGVFESLGGGVGIGEDPITYPPSDGSSSAYGAWGIASGPDGNLWFTESHSPEDVSFVGNITTGGTINTFSTGFTRNPEGIVAAPDGNLWFAEPGTNTIGNIVPTSTSTVNHYTIPTSNSGSTTITVGQDGNLWFTESAANKIGVITTGGAFPHEYPIPAGVNAVGIAAAGSGYQIGDIVTVVQAGASGGTFSVSAVDANGRVIVSPPGLNLQSIGTGYSVSTAPSNTTGGHGTGLQVNVASTTNSFGPVAITLGPDGNVWFVAASGVANNIIEVSPTGQFTAYPVPIGGSAEFITAGPDGNIWYTDNFNSAIAQLVPSTGVTTEFPTPTANSGPWGIGIGPAVQPVPAPPPNAQGSSPFGAPVITWTASPSSGVVGYNVYRSPIDNSVGPFVLVNSSLITGTTFTDLGASTTQCGGHTFYYFVTAVGTGKTESQDSNQANAAVQGSC